MRVRTQKLIPPGSPRKSRVNGRYVYHNRVEIIGLDLFIIQARKACGYDPAWTPRRLLTALLEVMPNEGRLDPKTLRFPQKDGSTVLFWLEK